MGVDMNDQERQSWIDEWFEAWNAHDLERILSHYAETVEMSSPMIQRVMGVASGCIKGKSTLRAYWAKALDLVPDLHFESILACWGVESVVLTYRGAGGRTVSEVLAFDAHGQVDRAHAHYALDPRFG